MTNPNRKELPDNPDVARFVRDRDDMWNIIYESFTRGAQQTAQQIYNNYNDHDCHQITIGVLIRAMGEPTAFANAAAAFDNEMRKLMGMAPADDPLGL